MRKTAWASMICSAVSVVFGALSVQPTAAQTLPTPVTTINHFPPPAPDAFSTSMRFGPNGLIYAWDGQKVWRQSGVNVDSFGAAAFGTVPSSGADAGPINFSQDGQILLIGNGFGGADFHSNGLLYTMPASGGAATTVGTVPNHFDLVPAPIASTMPGSQTKFLVDLGGSSFSTSEVDSFDFATAKVAPIIQNIPGASTSIAFDSANRLYVGIGYDAQHQQGQIRRFTLPLVDFAFSGQPLDWTSGQVFNAAGNNSGSGMVFDARGNLFTGGPNGVAVFDKNGASQLYGTGLSSYASVTYNATNDQTAVNTYGANPSIYNAADFNVAASPAIKWNVDSGGNWTDGSHWDPASAPNGIDQRAVLGGAITVPRTLALDAPVTLGTLTFDSSRKYLVNGSNALTIQVSSAIAAINVNTGSHQISAPVALASDTDVTVTNSADSLTLSGGVSGSGSLSKEGRGTLLVTAANTYLGNMAVDGGTLRFKIVSGAATVGTGTTVTVAPGATLELAGPVSALGTAGGSRARIINDSPGAPGSAGLVVSGTNQTVGGIDGAGVTTIDVGSDLTADHANQSALVIGGSTASFARLTIAPSDAAGNPLATATTTLILADSLTPRAPFGERIDSANSIAEPASAGTANASLSAEHLAADTISTIVPEPSSLLLTLIAAVALGARIKRNP